MRVASDWLLALSRLCLHSLARMGSQEGPRTFSGQRRCLSLGPANLVVSCHQCGTSAASRHRQLWTAPHHWPGRPPSGPAQVAHCGSSQQCMADS